MRKASPSLLSFRAAQPVVAVRYAAGPVAPARPADGLATCACDSTNLVTFLPNVVVGQPYAVSIFTAPPGGTPTSRLSVVLPAGRTVAYPLPVTGLSVTAGSGSAGVSWTAPDAGTGGSRTELRLDGVMQPGSGPSRTLTGLGTGRDHLIQVVDVGALRSAAVTTTLRGSTLTLAAPRILVAGGRATLTATLRHGGVGVPSRRVVLLGRRHGTTVFGTVSTIGTGATGTAVFSVSPTASWDYQVRFDGVSTDLGSASLVVGLPVATRVWLSVSRGAAPVGTSVRLSVSVGPGKPGQAVVLQRLVAGTWRTAATLRLSPTSTASLTLRLGTRGRVSWRAVRAADAGNAAGVSGTVVVTAT